MTLLDSIRIAAMLLALKRNRSWNSERVSQFQDRALVRMMRHAVETVPYYGSLGIPADSISSAADLQRFPILRKPDVQRLGAALLSSRYEADQLRFSRTSGSSGEPTTTWFDNECWLLCKYALKFRRMIENRTGPFRHVVIVSEKSDEELSSQSAPTGARFLYRSTYVSIHRPVEEHLRMLRSASIDAIYAFPSYLDDLINYAKSHSTSLPSIGVVFTSSEVLTSSLRQRIQDAFRATVCDIYGSTEFKEIAVQCPSGRYHVNFSSTFIEARSANQPALITSISNKAMPLLRFELGDVVSVASGPCNCGRAGPALARIDGRTIEMARLAGNRTVSPYLLTTAIESDENIAKYQIIQHSLSEIEVRYVTKKPGSTIARHDQIVIDLRKHLDGDMLISFTPVSEIPKSDAGKHKIFVQRMV